MPRARQPPLPRAPPEQSSALPRLCPCPPPCLHFDQGPQQAVAGGAGRGRGEGLILVLHVPGLQGGAVQGSGNQARVGIKDSRSGAGGALSWCCTWRACLEGQPPPASPLPMPPWHPHHLPCGTWCRRGARWPCRCGVAGRAEGRSDVRRAGAGPSAWPRSAVEQEQAGSAGQGSRGSLQLPQPRPGRSLGVLAGVAARGIVPIA